MPPARTKSAKPKDESAAVLEKIAAMRAPYHDYGARLHALILRSAPTLQPRVWYGMPGYSAGGPVILFFRVDETYMTFGLTEKAHFTRAPGDDHQLLASAWFFSELDDATEARIAEIVRMAVG